MRTLRPSHPSPKTQAPKALFQINALPYNPTPTPFSADGISGAPEPTFSIWGAIGVPALLPSQLLRPGTPCHKLHHADISSHHLTFLTRRCVSQVAEPRGRGRDIFG
jgi:hypothetical protein